MKIERQENQTQESKLSVILLMDMFTTCSRKQEGGDIEIYNFYIVENNRYIEMLVCSKIWLFYQNLLILALLCLKLYIISGPLIWTNLGHRKLKSRFIGKSTFVTFCFNFYYPAATYGRIIGVFERKFFHEHPNPTNSIHLSQNSQKYQNKQKHTF